MTIRKKVKSIHDRIRDNMMVEEITRITATEALRDSKEFGYDADPHGEFSNRLYSESKYSHGKLVSKYFRGSA